MARDNVPPKMSPRIRKYQIGKYITPKTQLFNSSINPKQYETFSVEYQKMCDKYGGERPILARLNFDLKVKNKNALEGYYNTCTFATKENLEHVFKDLEMQLSNMLQRMKMVLDQKTYNELREQYDFTKFEINRRDKQRNKIDLDSQLPGSKRPKLERSIELISNKIVIDLSEEEFDTQPVKSVTKSSGAELSFVFDKDDDESDTDSNIEILSSPPRVKNEKSIRTTTIPKPILKAEPTLKVEPKQPTRSSNPEPKQPEPEQPEPEQPEPKQPESKQPELKQQTSKPPPKQQHPIGTRISGASLLFNHRVSSVPDSPPTQNEDDNVSYTQLAVELGEELMDDNTIVTSSTPIESATKKVPEVPVESLTQSEVSSTADVVDVIDKEDELSMSDTSFDDDWDAHDDIFLKQSCRTNTDNSVQPISLKEATDLTGDMSILPSQIYELINVRVKGFTSPDSILITPAGEDSLQLTSFKIIVEDVETGENMEIEIYDDEEKCTFFHLLDTSDLKDDYTKIQENLKVVLNTECEVPLKISKKTRIISGKYPYCYWTTVTNIQHFIA
ncbi:hypothetical protein G210_4691 [Candida maltosa Xu316]|uniref:Uncharacterized protein n=1 Tax=Candida maltosa (strain Xu316) TaxID=1245528 RepID=M3K642_CANMX|nr:hypothetical protein G210_4691 [Candida maltosa Xu316]